MEQKFNKKFWNNYFKVYDGLNFLIPYQDLIKTIIKELNLTQEDIVMDAGSGTGNLAVLIRDKVKMVVCVDNSQAGIDIHFKKDPSATIILHDLRFQLPFQDNYFSKIYSNNTLYLIEPTYRPFVVKEFFRVLRPGGKIVINNILIGFRPYIIYFDHIRFSLKRLGFFMSLRQILSFLPLTIKIFYYNFLIKKHHLFGDYRFMESHEQKFLLKKAGFVQVSYNKVLYSGQSILNSAFKPKL